jgi:hypothetical protein
MLRSLTTMKFMPFAWRMASSQRLNRTGGIWRIECAAYTRQLSDAAGNPKRSLTSLSSTDRRGWSCAMDQPADRSISIVGRAAAAEACWLALQQRVI